MPIPTKSCDRSSISADSLCFLVVPTRDPLAVATQQSVQTPGFGSKDEVEEEAVHSGKLFLNFKVS